MHHPVKCVIFAFNGVPVLFSVGSTTSSTALQNEGELGDDDVFTVSMFPTFILTVASLSSQAMAPLLRALVQHLQSASKHP